MCMVSAFGRVVPNFVVGDITREESAQKAGQIHLFMLEIENN